MNMKKSYKKSNRKKIKSIRNLWKCHDLKIQWKNFMKKYDCTMRFTMSNGEK